MDNKVLIGYCQKLGMNVKDSALASISEEERDRVLAFIKQGAHSDPAAKSEALVPTREPVKSVVSKVPTIRTSASKGPLARELRREAEPLPDAPLRESHSAPAVAESGKTPLSQPAGKEARPG